MPDDTGDIVRRISKRPPVAQENTYGNADQERKQPHPEHYTLCLSRSGPGLYVLKVCSDEIDGCTIPFKMGKSARAGSRRMPYTDSRERVTRLLNGICARHIAEPEKHLMTR